MRSFFLALAFLTAVPVSPALLPPRPNLSRAAPFFPAVGVLLGLFLGGLTGLGLRILPAGPVVVLIFIVEFLLTRGLHLDGLADTADGLAASVAPQPALKIMRDAAVGPMGAGALIFFYLFKYAALTALPPSQLVLTITLLPAAGRWCLVLAGAASSPAREEGLGQAFIKELNGRQAAVATLVPAGLLTAFYFYKPSFFPPLLVGGGGAALVSLLFTRAVSRSLGGITGDVLGATCLVAELGFLVGVMAL